VPGKRRDRAQMAQRSTPEGEAVKRDSPTLPLVPGSSKSIPGTQGLPEIFRTKGTDGSGAELPCGRDGTIRLFSSLSVLRRRNVLAAGPVLLRLGAPNSGCSHSL